MAKFVEQKFWVVLPYEQLRTLPELQLSSAAVKEERKRKPRLLCDHSWYPVNKDTVAHAPAEAMQFGGALQRILRLIRSANPAHGPVYLAKYDIKDGFYRLALDPLQCLRLSIILPKYDDEPQLVAVPMACTMGWVQSPPTFCAMSETATDLINDRIDSPDYEPPPHRLDNLVTTGDHWDPEPMLKGPEDSASDARLQEHCQPPRSSPETERAPPSNLLADRPVGATDVYMDDFIQAYQGAPSHLLRAR